MRLNDSLPTPAPPTRPSEISDAGSLPPGDTSTPLGADSFERVAREGEEPSVWKIVRDRVMGDVAPPGVSDGAGAAEALVEIQKSGLPMKMTTDHLNAIMLDPTLDSKTQNGAMKLLESANEVPGGDVGHALQWQQKNEKELKAVLRDAREQGWEY